ncbi:oxidoreductase [Pseudomonas putida]|uniref:nitric oxide dioxygenase n=1 Tax=Pseudomonas putida TaxID=303 RepID=A0A2Z4RH11_PSEPU|nr:FAD-binding oxidoreductase [Pseudomonas putida]AWY39608.1 oxidoreductase [Pseudomonas putida]
MSIHQQPPAVQKGFLTYRVVEKRRESELVTSFLLAANDPLPAFRPGQFVVVRLPGDDGGTLLRNYSLSGKARDATHLRISVKREPAPAGRPDLPAGKGSGYLHEHVRVGDLLEIAGPVGDFVLDEESRRPVVLFSGGVGITPMVSMLHSLSVDSQRRVYFVHACENGAVHAFRDEVLALAASRPGIDVHFCYRQPGPDDLGTKAFHSQGLIERPTLQALLPIDDYEVYLCGPRPFMQANWRLLRELGVDKERIHYEFFGPATVLEEDETSPVVTEVSPVREAAADEALMVQFLPSGTRMAWNPDCHSLLDLAEQAGLQPAFNCRAGLCNACRVSLRSGSVEYFEAPLDAPDNGDILLCCSRPVSAVTVEIAPSFKEN